MGGSLAPGMGARRPALHGRTRLAPGTGAAGDGARVGRASAGARRQETVGRSTGAQIGSRLSLVILVFSVNARKNEGHTKTCRSGPLSLGLRLRAL